MERGVAPLRTRLVAMGVYSHPSLPLHLSPSPPLLSLLPTSSGQIRAFHIDAEQLTHQPPREVSKGWNDLKVKISLGTCIIAVSLHWNQVQGTNI